MTATLEAPATTAPVPGDAPARAGRAGLLGRLSPPMPTDRLAGWLGPLAVTLVAGLLRLWHVSSPRGLMFDEVYYTPEAHELLQHGVEHNRGYLWIVHPPLGKWMIAVGEAMFGYVDAAGHRHGNPELGWRFSAAVAGTLTVLVLARVARRMFRSTLLGCLAGLLISLDGLELVQSRIGILDIFVLFWLVLALACLVLDRDDGRRRLAARLGDRELPVGGASRRASGPWLGVRWWRLACGVCLGAMAATKWSGLYCVAGFGLLALAWDIGARRGAGVRHPVRAVLGRDLPSLVTGFGVVPLGAYLASWTGWFLSNDGYERHVRGSGVWGSLLSLAKYHTEMWHFHKTLYSPHPYASKPFSWLVLGRPVLFFYSSPKLGQDGCRTATGCSRAVLDIGTPAIWWGGTLAVLGCLGLWAARRDWRAALVVVGLLANFIPWLPDGRRTMFFFYALPMLPFLVLGLTAMAAVALGPAAAGVRRRRVGAAVVGAGTLLVVWNFAYMFPVLTGQTIPYVAWHARMWFPGWI